MEKLAMCRICLVANVSILAVNKNLQEVYEKLTDIPFVTEDRRPMLACIFCCVKLKQCYRLLRQCLEAEKLFAQMMNEDYEPNPLINQDHFRTNEFFSGFIKSPTVNMSIVDVGQTQNIVVKEELPAVCDRLDDIIQPKEEHQCDELEPENFENSYLDVADIRPYHSESDLEEDAPLMEFKIEVDEEQAVSKNKQRACELKKDMSVADMVQTENIAVKEELPAVCERLDDIIQPKEEHQSDELGPENFDNSCLDVADILHHSESDLEEDVPLKEFKIEVDEEQTVSKNKRRARETKRATVAKKPKLDTRRTKLDDEITAKRTKKEKSDSKVIRINQKRISKPGAYYKELYKCDQRSFNLVKKNIQHSRTQLGEAPYKCDVCHCSFNKKCNLSRHINVIHSGKKPYKCNVCQRSFSEKSNLSKHIIVIHSGKKPYKCNVCQRSFSVKNYLSKHIVIHTDEKPYKCDVCHRGFSDKGHLTNHVRIHTGEKPYKCNVCNSGFNTKGYLTNHIRIHTGEKPHKCDVCQRSFTHKSVLTKHIRIHTGEKPHKCDVCQRSFSHKSALTNHIRTHTGEKPFKCDICQCSFRQRIHLTIHIRTHTGENPSKSSKHT